MKTPRLLLSTLIVVVFWSIPTHADHYSSRYAAIAYSQSTCRFGYSHGKRSRSAAECEATDRCRADDAQVVVWTRNKWCVLALGDDQQHYGYGWGSSASRAKSIALRQVRERTTGCYIAACVYAGG